MKRNLSGIALVSLATFFFTACGSSKKVATNDATKEAVGDKEIIIPCAEFRSDKTTFRASQSSNSTNLSQSRDEAYIVAKQRLASLIESELKAVIQRYASEREINNKSEFNDKFETMSRDVVKQTLRDTRIVCEKTMQKSDGSYNTFIAVECDKESIYNGVNKGLANDEKLRQDYDVMKFKEVFDQEMDKLEKGQK
jgi:hypothetical protein